MATSSEAFKSFRSTGVVVFANSKSDSSALPAGAREVRSEAGNTIPMVFVTTANGEKGIQGIPYATLKEDMRKAIRGLKDTLKTADVLGTITEPTPETTEETASTTEEPENKMFAESQEWTNAAGKPITAAIKAVEGDQVKFVMADGRELDYSLAKLSADSQKKIEEIKSK